MASPVLQIVSVQQVPASATTLYTSASGVWTQITKVLCQNTDSAAQSITIYIIPSGGSAGTTTLTTNAQALLPAQSWSSPNEVGLVLNPGDAIAALATTAAKINIAVSGTQFTG